MTGRSFFIGEFHHIPDHANSNLNSLAGTNGGRLSYEQSIATLSSSELIRHSGEIAMKDVVFDPQEILALFASGESQSKGETLMLRDIHSMNHTIFIVVETTCPVHKSVLASSNSHDHTNEFYDPIGRKHAKKVDVVLDMKEHDMSEMDESNDNLPEWLKNDLEDANADDPDELKRRKDGNGRRHKRSNRQHPSSKEPERKRSERKHEIRGDLSQENSSNRPITSDERDQYIERLEKEYNKKRKELLLEAENAVRVREEAFNQELIRVNQELDRHKQMQRGQIDAKKNLLLSEASAKKFTGSKAEGDKGTQNGNPITDAENGGGKGCNIQ